MGSEGKPGRRGKWFFKEREKKGINRRNKNLFENWLGGSV